MPTKTAEPVAGETSASAADGSALLLQYLRQTDVACPLCGYNLRGLTSPRCPECGNELRLSVGLREPVLRYWMMLATVVCASAGIGLFFLLFAAFHGEFATFFLTGRFETREAFVSVWYFALSLLAVPGVLFGRRRICRWPRATQKRLAITSLFASSFAIVLLARGLI